MPSNQYQCILAGTYDNHTIILFQTYTPNVAYWRGSGTSHHGDVRAAINFELRSQSFVDSQRTNLMSNPERPRGGGWPAGGHRISFQTCAKGMPLRFLANQQRPCQRFGRTETRVDGFLNTQLVDGCALVPNARIAVDSTSRSRYE